MTKCSRAVPGSLWIGLAGRRPPQTRHKRSLGAHRPGISYSFARYSALSKDARSCCTPFDCSRSRRQDIHLQREGGQRCYKQRVRVRSFAFPDAGGIDGVPHVLERKRRLMKVIIEMSMTKYQSFNQHCLQINTPANMSGSNLRS